ncbi:MAG: hypothetical protein LBD24_04530 [Spirochaetaceae bacterium]|jgi:hypothetical protein|nr:hypothetical protein [Spirochaetaceae bacterium]
MPDRNGRKPGSFKRIMAVLQETYQDLEEINRAVKETAIQREENEREIQELTRLFKEISLETGTGTGTEIDRRFKEIVERFKEADRRFKETDRKFKETAERFKETNRRFRAISRRIRETDGRSKETERTISRLGTGIGRLIERLAGSDILEKFGKLGCRFVRISRNHRIKDPSGRVLTEIDLLLENDECAAAVEVKSLFTYADVKEHLKKMNVMRDYGTACQDTRRYSGAVAGTVIEDRARECALQNGLYVIEQTGDRVRILSPTQPPAVL